MAELDITQPPGELNAFPRVESTQFSGEMQEYLASIHSLRTGTPIEDARQEIATLGEGRFKEISRLQASSVLASSVRLEAEQAVENGSLEQLVAIEQDRSIRQEVVTRTEAPEILVETGVAVGEIWDRAASVRASREATVVKALAEASAEVGEYGVIP